MFCPNSSLGIPVGRPHGLLWWDTGCVPVASTDALQALRYPLSFDVLEDFSIVHTLGNSLLCSALHFLPLLMEQLCCASDFL